MTFSRTIFALLAMASVGAGLPPLPSTAHIKKHHVAPLLSPKQQSIQIVKTKVASLAVARKPVPFVVTCHIPAWDGHQASFAFMDAASSPTGPWTRVVTVPCPIAGGFQLTIINALFDPVFYRAGISQ